MLLEDYSLKRASVVGKFFTNRTVGYDYINRRPIVEKQYFDLERTRTYSGGRPVFKVNYQFLEGKKYFCQGYSGTPVYTFYGDNIALYGIVTKGAAAVRGELGENCGDTLVVEPVSEHIEWIKQVSKQ